MVRKPEGDPAWAFPISIPGKDRGLAQRKYSWKSGSNGEQCLFPLLPPDSLITK